MLKDLAQFLSNNIKLMNADALPYDFQYLRNLYKNIYDQEILKDFKKDLLKLEALAVEELITQLPVICNEMTLHIYDCFENAILQTTDLVGNFNLQMFFNTFLSKNDYVLNTISGSLEDFFRENMIINNKFNVTAFDNIFSKQALDELKNIVNLSIEESTIFDETLQVKRLDDYLIDTVYITCQEIKIKNKSKARKLRKLYENSAFFSEYLNMLDMYMIQGRFIITRSLYIDAYSMDDLIDYNLVKNAIYEVRQKMEVRKINKIPEEINTKLMELTVNLEPGNNLNAELCMRLLEAHSPERNILF